MSFGKQTIAISQKLLTTGLFAKKFPRMLLSSVVMVVQVAIMFSTFRCSEDGVDTWSVEISFEKSFEDENCTKDISKVLFIDSRL